MAALGWLTVVGWVVIVTSFVHGQDDDVVLSTNSGRMNNELAANNIRQESRLVQP